MDCLFKSLIVDINSASLSLLEELEILHAQKHFALLLCGKPLFQEQRGSLRKITVFFEPSFLSAHLLLAPAERNCLWRQCENLSGEGTF